MAAILNSTILDSAILVVSSQTHSHLPGLVPTIYTKKTTLTFPFPPFAQKILYSFILTQLDDGSYLEFYHVGLRKLHSFILTQLDDGSHLEFCHVGFRHLVFFSQIHSKTLSLHSDSWLKLIQSDSNSFISHSTCHLEWLPSWIQPSWVYPHKLDSATLPRLVPTICTKETHTCQDWSLHTICTKNTFTHFILTQLDDGSHLEFYHVGLKNFTHSYWLNLMMAAILILPCWIQTPCFLLSDSLKNTTPSTLTLDSN